ncbi:MAG: transposase [candidate division NC10 bacterium]|nr:transposase [candidate division NC10 bacterium]MDE2322407.1 transposase [candidate division NC10 bacterium]
MPAKQLQHRPFQRAQQNIINAFVGFLCCILPRQWLCRASSSRPEPFQQLARMPRIYLNSVLTGIRIRVTNGAVKGVNNKVAAIGCLAFGYRPSWVYVATISHRCTGLLFM